jgi:hypothetical protein
MQWVCFDLDGKLHSCPNKPLAIETRQLIKEAIEMIPDDILTNTNNIEVLNTNNIEVLYGRNYLCKRIVT